ncbi:MAG TPA: 50S ribosomal protein L11 methyltransferase [Kofleriaceae bacterium]|nr:50S ribosomal protein L11 methyltransferase [Kofleriaceae bacterium]
MSDWLEIAVPVLEAGSADDVAGLLHAELPDAAAGVELRDGEVVYWVPLDRGEAALEAARRVGARMAAAGHPIDAARIALRPALPEAEWRDAWKRTFRTVRLTRQIVVVPSWDSCDPQPDDRLIHLDPGQAFGTGAHASTRLVLELMQELADGDARPGRVLDLGAGSGILALAAAGLWPEAAIEAVDIDPIAVDAARENAEANRVAHRIRVSDTPVERIAGSFDLVLANIQADVLAALSDEVVARVAPGGHLILSGLLSEQVAGTAALYAARGLEVVRTCPSGDDPAWSAALLRRP